MKAIELANILCGSDRLTATGTADTFKIGDPERELTRVALCFIATPNLIKEAAAWGAEMIITHEPTFYQHWDEMTPYKFAAAKKELLKKTGVTLFRYHDHPHTNEGRDLFSEGFIEELGWQGTFENPLVFVLDEPMSPREMVRDLENVLDSKHIRVAGEVDRPTNRVALLLGARGGEWNDYFLMSEDVDVAIGGEVCEWAICEGARDATQLGIPKTAIVMGHCASERDGMKYITRIMQDKFADSGIEFKYFECGETFTKL